MKKLPFHIISLLTIIILLLSCRHSDEPPFKPIPDDALINILTDTYIAGGLMNVAQVRDMYRYRDSLSNYIEIVKHYGYRSTQVDSTLKYYFINKPKKLEKVFDAVTGKLLEMQTEVENPENTGTQAAVNKNLWNGRPSFTFPEEFFTDSIPFTIPVKTAGVYTFSASYRLFPDDQSIDPELKINFSNFRGKGEEFVTPWEKCPLQKDGRAHTIVLKKELTNTENAFVRGFLFYHSNKKGGEWQKHARITDISLTVVPLGKADVVLEQ
ncbi:MAG TPA: DUF4296 domain-containing protein [Bacteroidales bacterium]|nr:DUF4296 domain-containing protein [Bacteroidales bacterium]HPT11889.1 DUF4296 domain-containing protein [Bacteroidales bacterium]